MSSKILFLLIVGLVSVKLTNAQSVQDVVNSLGELIGAIIEGIVELVSQIVSAVLSVVTQLISAGINNPNDTSLSSVLSALTQLNSNDTVVSSVLGALSQLISTTINNPNDSSAIGALLTALQQAIQNIANCGVLKSGKQYYLQSVDGSYKEGYVQSSFSSVDRERGAILTRQLAKASKFTAVQKSCNVYGLCVRGLCMSRCEGCNTGANQYQNQNQTVTFHVTNSTGTFSQWELSSIGAVVGGPYNLKSDIGQYLDYVRLNTGAAVVSLNATLLPESQFKFIEAEPCAGILEDGQQYYLKSGNADYVVVNGVLAYLEQIEEARATKFRAVQWDCNVYGFCIEGTDGVQCMSRCENCGEPDTENYQSVRFHVNDSFRPYSQWTLLNSTNNGLYTYTLYAEDHYGNIYFNPTSSGARQLILDLNHELELKFIKVT